MEKKKYFVLEMANDEHWSSLSAKLLERVKLCTRAMMCNLITDYRLKVLNYTNHTHNSQPNVCNTFS